MAMYPESDVGEALAESCSPVTDDSDAGNPLALLATLALWQLGRRSLLFRERFLEPSPNILLLRGELEVADKDRLLGVRSRDPERRRRAGRSR